jgi:hypothetical protein
MKDVTTTSFGLIIAYLLPGLAGLYSFSFSFEPIRLLFEKFGTEKSDVGLFFLVILAAVTIGLQVSIFRWLLFEKGFWVKLKLETKQLANLANKDKHTAFRTLIDEQYRYHQFWGGMTLVQAPLFIEWIRTAHMRDQQFWFATAAAILLEICTFLAGKESYERYITRAKAILEGNSEAQTGQWIVKSEDEADDEDE